METDLGQVSNDDLYHRSGRALSQSLPEGWGAVTYVFEVIDDDVWEESAVVDLVRRMDEAGRDTWRKALFSMAPGGEFKIDDQYGRD